MNQNDAESEKRIAEIRERESKATKEPWAWDANPCDDSADFRDQNAPWLNADNDSNFPKKILHGDIFCASEGDRDFIAHSRADISYLLSRVTALEDELKAAHRVIDKSSYVGCGNAITIEIERIQNERDAAREHIESLEAKLAEADAQIRTHCKDWADDHTCLKQIVKELIPTANVEGDSFGVPDIQDFAGQLHFELSTLRRQVEEAKLRENQLITALTKLRSAIKEVLLPKMNEKGPTSMWLPEEMQWTEAVALTDTALNQLATGKEKLAEEQQNSLSLEAEIVVLKDNHNIELSTLRRQVEEAKKLGRLLKRSKKFLSQCNCAGSDGWNQICNLNDAIDTALNQLATGKEKG